MAAAAAALAVMAGASGPSRWGRPVAWVAVWAVWAVGRRRVLQTRTRATIRDAAIRRERKKTSRADRSASIPKARCAAIVPSGPAHVCRARRAAVECLAWEALPAAECPCREAPAVDPVLDLAETPGAACLVRKSPAPDDPGMGMGMPGSPDGGLAGGSSCECWPTHRDVRRCNCREGASTVPQTGRRV